MFSHRITVKTYYIKGANYVGISKHDAAYYAKIWIKRWRGFERWNPVYRADVLPLHHRRTDGLQPDEMGKLFLITSLFRPLQTLRSPVVY